VASPPGRGRRCSPRRRRGGGGPARRRSPRGRSAGRRGRPRGPRRRREARTRSAPRSSGRPAGRRTGSRRYWGGPSCADELPVDLRQRLRQPLGGRDHGIATPPEEPGKPRLAVTVHGDPEDGMAETPRLLHRLAAVLDAVAALVVVKVVGLAVGDDEQEPATAGLACEAGRGVADRGAETRV